jgi:hypothetical protein
LRVQVLVMVQVLVKVPVQVRVLVRLQVHLCPLPMTTKRNQIQNRDSGYILFVLGS